jgi:hypothetical protein
MCKIKNHILVVGRTAGVAQKVFRHSSVKNKIPNEHFFDFAKEN